MTIVEGRKAIVVVHVSGPGGSSLTPLMCFAQEIHDSTFARWSQAVWSGTSTVNSRGTRPDLVVPHPPLLPAFAAVAPYNATIVELEEDPLIRFAGNLVASSDGEINEIDPATIRIGEPVRVVFHRIDDVSLPRWVRAT